MGTDRKRARQDLQIGFERSGSVAARSALVGKRSLNCRRLRREIPQVTESAIITRLVDLQDG